MPARVQKAPIVVLTVQFHQMVGQVAQHLAADAAVIHESGLAPVALVDAAQDQLFPGRDARGIQHGSGAIAGRGIEHRRHLALRSALAHQIGAAAPAQHKAQRIQQDRLARTGFAGQHVQARPKLQA